MRFVLIPMLGLTLTSPTLHAENPQTNPGGVMNETNPFFAESTLPYQLPPFDDINDAHYLPAIERGMREQIEEIQHIANADNPPTLENTLVALERSGRLLDRVATTFFTLSRAHTNDTMDAVRSEVAPKLAAHSDQILLNSALFERVKTLYDNRNDLELGDESRRLIEQYYTDFVRAGAELSEPEKTRMQEINTELATLQTTFAQNVLNEVNASAVVIETRAELAGLTESQLAAAAAAATAQGLDGKYVISLLNTSGQPSLSSLENRELRERIARTSRQPRW